MFLTSEEAQGGRPGLISNADYQKLATRCRAQFAKTGERMSPRHAARVLGRNVACEACGWRGRARVSREKRLRSMVCPQCRGWRTEPPAGIEHPRLWQARHPDGRGTLRAAKPPHVRRRP